MKILAYHNITNPEQFENQIDYLKNNYDIINLDSLKNHIFSNDPLPENPLLISFDDGDFSIYKNAFPVLKKHHVPAVVFVITGLINTYKPFWWDEIIYHLGPVEGEKKVWEVKNWPNSKRKEFLEQLRIDSKKSTFVHRQLSSEQLFELKEHDIAIANHSFSHPMLNQCSEEALREEIYNSFQFLKENQFEPEVFAYPNGNFSEKVEETLKSEGIKMAFLFDHKINSKKINPLRISRLIVDDITPLWKFKFILSGYHTKILPITKKIGKFLK
ncbi:MAG TPA: polysaccharide deacetylase family protein [Salinimicrobium sp.]|nr:polysaccharide deacetylase family protein [Salinimicrobium sp.]